MTKKKKPMFLFYFSITLAICSSTLYHFTAKSTPSNVNFTVSLLVTYAVAFIVVLLTLFFFPVKSGIAFELKQLNWASIGLAIAIVGIEFAIPTLPIGQAGNLGIAAVLVNVVASFNFGSCGDFSSSRIKFPGSMSWGFWSVWWGW